MKNIKNFLHKYLPFSKAGIKGFLVYKAQIFMWLFISFLEILFVVFLYQAIYRNSDDGMNSIINGFNFYEMILYMITSFIFSFVVFQSETSWNIFQDIKEGTIANTLTKPVSYRLRHSFACFGVTAIGFLVIMVPLISIVYGIFIYFNLVAMTILEFLLNFLVFIVFAVIATLINDAISYTIGLLTFFTEHMFGLNLFRNSLQGFLSGQLIPLSFMGVVGVVFSFTPFAFMNSTPVLTLMGKLELYNMAIYLFIGVVWIVILEGMNKILFKYCVKRVSVQGG